MLSLLEIACLTGFIGDMILQLDCKYFHFGGPTCCGLKEYFKQHGRAESTFIAGGMLTLFYILLGPLPKTYLVVAIHGIIIDLIFRKTMLFPSLKGYYEYFNYFWSAFWIAVPMMIPLFIYNSINHINR
jgi:hypothetical protein